MRTLVVGGVACLFTSFFVESHEYGINLMPFDFIELLGLVLFFLVFGFVVSVISQAGFFAYLFIHQFGLGMFRSYWSTIQLVLVLFVGFDLVYFPYRASDGDVSIWLYILMSVGLLAYGYLIARIKVKQTNKSAFVPALFLMVVLTTIEWVPGLQTEGTDYAILMIFPLLACNTYQLLVLHKLTASKEKNIPTQKSESKKQLNQKTHKA